MDCPPVSILINAFGRTWILNEALAAAHEQNYAGIIEIVVVNDLQEQRLVAPARTHLGRDWSVHNLPTRHRSLGEKRNAGFALCTYPTIIMADDDDIMLPWSVRTLVAEHLRTGKPTWAGSHFYSLGSPPEWEVKVIPYQSAQHGLVTKAHHLDLDGFKPLSTKDDIEFYHRALAKYGPRCRAELERPEYIYRWGTDTYHLAGSSDCVSSWERAYQTALDDIRSGREPGGRVELAPQLMHDYVAALGLRD